MNVGDMGSTYQRSYRVLGDTMDLGFRLESLIKFYGIRLLTGEKKRLIVMAFYFAQSTRVK